jgi:pyrimidine operon attenuation protein/uracil phosphoribosyltransferase
MANEVPPTSRPQGPDAPESNSGSSVSFSSSISSTTPATHDRVVLDDPAIRRALTRITHEIIERHEDLSSLYLIAIPNGGVPLGRILAENIAHVSDVVVPVGVLDTTLYRDDLTRRGARPPLRRTEMPSSVDEREVIIVEDVVSTGRTIRAAMDALMDFGRPRRVQVVSLVDRGHRELPIKIDYVGKNIPTSPGEKVKFRGVGNPELEAPYEVVVHRDGARGSEDDRGGGA